jgi:putative tryptophan/tyrosine transport system substrate-binding protein
MRRRDFIKVIGVAGAIWPIAALSQQPTLPVIAYVRGGSGGANSEKSYVPAFTKGLSEAGYADGRNVAVEYHYLEGHYERLPVLMQDLAQRHVAVIATPGFTPGALAAKAATATVPLVFGVGEDPVKLGLVASLAHPAGNATGINFFSYETNAKRLGIMHALLPEARRLALLLNPGDAQAEAVAKALGDAAAGVGLEAVVVNARTPDEIDAVFAGFARERPDALFIAGDAFFATRTAQLVTLTTREHMPASFSLRAMVDAGLLMSYGADFIDSFRQVGVYSGRILNGEKPADLPVLQSTKFEFALNLKTARAFGIAVPSGLLATADEVIE